MPFWTAVPPVEAVPLGALRLAPLSELQVVGHVAAEWLRHRGGWIVTANVDIARAVDRDVELAKLISGADLVVADGMPLVWAARLAGRPLPGRVTGSSLIHSLATAAEEEGRSVFLLGGDAGVPERAAQRLTDSRPSLKIVGTSSPPIGFDRSQELLQAEVDQVVAAAPDLVFVGLGFPKQERVINAIRPLLPGSWFLGCGAAIAMAAGQFSRAPTALQNVGGEWLHRLAIEPRRLGRRYLYNDLPFALRLLASSRFSRSRNRHRPPASERASEGLSNNG